jgi:hypothetical protein
MPDPTHDHALFSEVVLAMKAWLGSELQRTLGLDPSVVSVSAIDDPPHHQAERDVVLRVQGERSVEGNWAGGGRHDDRRKRQVKVICRTRMWLDQADRDDLLLTSVEPATLGHLALEDAVADALQTWQGLRANGDALNYPAYVGDLTDPEKEKSTQGPTGWVSSHFTVRLEYDRLYASGPEMPEGPLP